MYKNKKVIDKTGVGVREGEEREKEREVRIRNKTERWGGSLAGGVCMYCHYITGHVILASPLCVRRIDPYTATITINKSNDRYYYPPNISRILP